MITKIAERAADMLYKTEVIPKEDRELYTYGFFSCFHICYFFL